MSKVTRSVSEGRFRAERPDSLADAAGYFSPRGYSRSNFLSKSSESTKFSLT